MPRSARVQSTDAIKAFRAKLIRFADQARAAMGDADAEVLRAGTWLRQDREPYWKSELRRRGEILQRAKSALSEKRLYKSASGARQSSVEEEKAYAVAKTRFEEAEHKVERIKHWLRQLDDERFIYKAQSQRMARAIAIDVPRAVATIDRILDRLDEYLHLTPDDQQALTAAAESMARGDDAAAYKLAEQLKERRKAEIKLVRDAALSSAERDEVPPRDDPPTWPVERRIPPAQLRALVKLDWPIHAADPDDIVIVARKIEAAERVAISRIRTSSPGDSGWLIAPVDFASDSADCVAITTAALLTSRPDLAAILNLPFETVVIESAAGIEYLCDESGEPVDLIVEEDEPTAEGESS